MDSRIIKLAENIVSYSCDIKPGEKVLINLNGKSAYGLAAQIIKEVYKAGGTPFIEILDSSLLREILLNCSTEQLKLMAEVDSLQMSKMDAYIGIRASDNINEFSDIPPEKLKAYSSLYNKPVHHDLRVPNTKWVVLRYPNASMAQEAKTSISSFEDFYYNVCNLDYSKMSKAMDALVKLMNSTDRVLIKGNGTDLSFSIKGIPAIKCAGKMNIPDGEVFTAPVKDSVNGIISYNVPSNYEGFTYQNVVLKFKDGKIIDAVSNDSKKINAVFDTDDGARYVGEFAIGVNPFIVKPMNDILFDEKIMGSFHFTPGNSYIEASNGNESSIHWDLICIQTLQYGGGEIHFDDVLIRKDGMFVHNDLLQLNPEHLK